MLRWRQMSRDPILFPASSAAWRCPGSWAPLYGPFCEGHRVSTRQPLSVSSLSFVAAAACALHWIDRTRIGAPTVMFLKRTLLAAVALALPSAALAEATTTRIETHAYYGATVTLEQGVRVFRPLPPHSKVIINPGGLTPIHLGVEESRSTSHNHYYDNRAGSSHPGAGSHPGVYGGYPAPVHGHGPHYGVRRYAPKHDGGK